MKELVFATVLAELKTSWGDTIADPDLINLLYDAVAEPVGLTNKNGEPITVTKGTASKIMNRQAGGNPNRSIRSKSADDRVLTMIEEYFKRNVVKRLLKGCEDDLIERLKTVINDDVGIADAKKQELLANAQKNTLAIFLASVYLYSLSRDNVLHGSSGTKPITATTELEVIPLPTGITGVEGSYTDALLVAYGQVEGIKHFTVDMLDTYPAHKENFSNQRKYYFAAEAVRRGTRDLYGAKEKDLLFTEEDLYEIVPAESKKERELKEAKKNAVIIYINEKIQDLTKKRGVLEEELAKVEDTILTLKEKVRKDELADPGMRTSLFRYMVDNCGDNQIIIAENEIPSAVDYSTARLIEFTQDETQGVYGFLKSVRNSVDS